MGDASADETIDLVRRESQIGEDSVGLRTEFGGWQTGFETVI